MKSRDMLKLVQASNKGLSRERILKAMGSQDEFLATDVGWITKQLKGTDADVDAITNDVIEFAQLNEKIKKIAQKENATYKPLDLIKVLNTPKFSSFISSRAPLRLHRNILAASDLLVRTLKEC